MKCRSLVLIFLIILSLSLASCSSGTGPASHENEMIAFNIVNVSPPATGVIDQSVHSIAITVPDDTDVTHLIATFTVSAGAIVYVNHNYSTVQQSGITTNDFTNPVVYTVWSAGNYLQDYTITVTTVASVSAKSISSLSLDGVVGTIDETGKTIAVTMPSGTNVTSLVATFTTTGASVEVGSTVQISGTTVHNFTNPVVYTVTAADGTTQDYTVTVTLDS